MGVRRGGGGDAGSRIPCFGNLNLEFCFENCFVQQQKILRNNFIKNIEWHRTQVLFLNKYTSFELIYLGITQTSVAASYFLGGGGGGGKLPNLLFFNEKSSD